MSQSTFGAPSPGSVPQGLHVAIIMDGNGRWAQSRGRSRSYGHQEGARAVRSVLEAAPDLGIGTMTLFAFSSDNWHRPTPEVRGLMRLFQQYLRSEARACAERGLRIQVVGRRDRLPPGLRKAVAAAEAETAACTGMLLRIALDYSAREAIVEAARRAGGDQELDRDRFEALLGDASLLGTPATPVDLLIRTGGEQRLSDFLLWECAYAELYFSGVMWPEFGPEELSEAVAEFHRRERRFGTVPGAATG